MRLPRVGIVIVNYNGCADTLECLRSLTDLTYANCFTIVVDQASNDGAVQAIRAQFPTVTVIESVENDGFTGGNNRGIRLALGRGADYVFLLNNDTIVAPGLIEPLVEAAEADPTIGLAGPLMLYFDAPETVWSAGGTMGTRGQSVMREQGRAVGGDAIGAATALLDVDFVVGCGLLCKRAVLEQIGLLDERFFLYYEEADLCARAGRAGWRIVTVPRARLWHKVSRTLGTESDLTLYYMRRNVLLYLEKNAQRSVSARAAALADALRLALVWGARGERRRSAVILKAVRDYFGRRLGKAS